MPTNYLDYFNARISEGAALPVAGDSKLDQLQTASQEKISKLTALKQVHVAQEQQAAQSFAGQMDLDPDSVAGTLANFGASVYSGVSRGVGDLASMGDAANVDNSLARLSTQEMDALNRNVKGVATPDDLVLINRKKSLYGDHEAGPLEMDAKSPLEMFQSIAKSNDRSVMVNQSFDRSDTVNQVNRRELNEDLGAGFKAGAGDVSKGWGEFFGGEKLQGSKDMLSGVAQLFYNAGSAVANHPKAVAEYVAENAPQLLVGMAGNKGRGVMSALNIGMASDTFQEGLQNYRNKNGGALPPEAELRKMAAEAAAIAAAEELGDVASLGLGKLAKAGTKAAKTGVIQGTKNIVKATGEGIVSEGATEGVQTYLEGEVLGKPASAQDIYTSAVIGGATGGALSGGMRTAAEVTKATPEHAKVRAAAVSDHKAQEEAIASGDVSALLDPKSPSYAPDNAVAALFGHSQKPDTPQEAKAANLVKADEIVAGLQDEKAVTQDKLAMASKDGLTGLIAQEQALLDDPQVTEEQRAMSTSNMGLFQKRLAKMEAGESFEKNAAHWRNKIAAIDKQISGATTAREQLSQMVQTSATVESQIAAISAPKTGDIDTDTQAAQAGQVAAEAVINLSMASPDRVDGKAAAALAANPEAHLTDSQRAYLRAFSEARIAENTLMDMNKVSQDIYMGAKNKGIKQYRTAMADALKAGKKKDADRELGGLKAFEQDHMDKAAKVAAAKPGQQVLRNQADRSWFINTGARLSDDAVRKNGGLTVNSQKLVEQIGTEAAALTTAVAELQSAYALKFNAGVPNVQNAPRQGSGTQGQPQATAVQAAGPARVDTSPAAGVSDRAGTAVRVEEAGVEKAETSEKSSAEEETAVSSKKSVETQKTQKTQRTEKTAEESQKTEENQSTEDSTVKVEASVAESPTAVEDDTTSSSTTTKAQTAPAQVEVKPGLTLLNRAKLDDEVELSGDTKLGLIYRTAKFIKARAFLSQKKTQVSKDTDIVKLRPLVEIQGLMARWNSADFDIQDFFSETLSEHELGALSNFKEFADKWAESIDAGFVKGFLGAKVSEGFEYQDPTQEFVGEDGKVDENVRTAVAYAAYTWLVDSLNAPKLDKEQILKMHGQDPESDTVTRQGQRSLSKVTSFEDIAINSLGKHIIDALGLKVNTKAPLSYLPNLTAAFGTHALLVLEAQGLIQRHVVGSDVLNKFIPSLEPTVVGHNRDGSAIYTTYSYVLIPRGEKFKPVGDAKRIKEASVKSRGAVTRFFGSELTPHEASWKPIPFDQEEAKRTNMGISTKQLRILEKAQKVENRIIPDMWNALKVLGDDVVLKAAGWVELENSKVQMSNRDAVDTQNINLENQLDGMRNLVQGAIDESKLGIDQPFFANFEVWKNFRVGVTTRDLNLQSSKIHRFSFARPEWQSTIHLDDEAAVQTFKIGVAQAMGIKVDQQRNDKTVEKFDALMLEEGNRTIELAILLNKAITDPEKNGDLLTAEHREAVAQLAAGAEGMQTLQALVAYGHFLAAQISGAESFTATMLVGVDGKTNGPIFSMLALGAANTADRLFKIINRGGFFRESDGVANYNHWYERTDSQDLYEDLASFLLGRLPTGMDKELAAFQVVTKQLMTQDRKASSAGRKIVKTPLTSFAFGSSVQKSVENMREAFLQGVIDRIEALANGTDSKLTRETLIDSINTLLTMGGAKKSDLLSMTADVTELMELDWDRMGKQQDMLRNAFNEIMGEAVDTGMNTYFEEFTRRRNAVNANIQSSYKIYEVIYKDLRNKEINRLMDEGDIAFIKEAGERVPAHDLTVGQEKALRERVEAILPRAHTAYTVGTDEIGSGLYMAKNGKGLSESPAYKVKVQRGVQTGTYKGRAIYHLGSRGIEKTELSPGVAGLPYFMHSFDSSVMHESLEDTDSLNVHDEAANAADKVNQTAERINHATWTNMLRFSPTTEAFQLLERTVINAVKLIESGDVSQTAVGAIMATLRGKLPKAMRDEIKTENIPFVLLSLSKKGQFEADTVRLEALGQLTAIDQYTWEGGEYNVTEDDRAEAKKAFQALEKQGFELSPETRAAANTLGKIFAEGVKSKVKEAPAVEPVLELAEAAEESTFEEAPKTATSPFGEAGTPDNVSDPAVVAFFKEHPNATAKQVVAFLYRKLSDRPAIGNRDFNLKLLKVLAKSVNPNLTVNLVTPQTQEADVLALPKNPSLGWYAATGGNEAIYITGNGFKHSNMQVEVLLHELTHAATASRLKAPAGRPFKDELELLLHKTQQYAKAQGITKFDIALTDVDELVAYGMTSRSFQQEVLAKVTMRPDSRGLSTAMHKFVDVLSRLLGFKSATEANGLGTLLTNVSALMEQGAKEQSQEQKDLNLSMSALVGALNTYSTLDIHAALDDGALTSSFDDHLRELLSGIVDNLHGPFGSLKATLMKDQALSPLDVWLKALNTGAAPFASQAQASGFNISEQVSFALEQVEATVKGALDANEARTKIAYRELSDLYVETYQRLKPQDFHQGDWAIATQTEKDRAQSLHDFIFKLEKDNGDRSNYLARFAAFGLAHPEFNQLLQAPTRRDSRRAVDAKTFADRLQIIFENVLEFFMNKVTHTYGGQPADEKLTRLVGQLVDIEAKKRHKLALPEGTNFLEPLEKGMNKFTDAVKDKAVAAMGSQFVRNNKFAMVQAAGAVGRTMAMGHADQFMEGMLQLREKHFKEVLGISAGIINNIKGPLENFKFLLLSAKNNERKRKAIITNAAKTALHTFINGGKDLTREAKSAVSAVFLRTGAHVLLDSMSMTDLENLLGNKPALDQKIAGLETQLDQFGRYKDAFVEDANGLGYYKATGFNRMKVLKLNAHNIARLAGSSQQSQLTEEEATQAESIIKELVSLYALRYSDSVAIQEAKRALQSENSRGGENGVEFVMRLHQRLEIESQARLFRGSAVLMVHGYTPEIYNPHIDVVTANEKEGKDLEARGYVKGAAVPLDPADPDRVVRHLYVQHDGGLARRITGAVSFTGMKAKGSAEHSGYLNPNNLHGLANAQTNAAILNQRRSTGTHINPGRDLSKEKGNYMAPVFNASGDIVNWRYFMAEATKDDVLQRTSSFDKVLGALAGSVFDKETTQEQNRKVVEVLREQYEADYATRKDAFLLVGPKSTDPELRDIWRLLPTETQHDVREVWGSDGMMVRSDSLDIIFGYRKLSLADMFDKDPDARHALEKLFIGVMEWNLTLYARTKKGLPQQEAVDYAKRAAVFITRGERAWQELVYETKDILVVKTGLTLIGNIWSNFSMLMLHGVSIPDMVKHHLVALKAATAYQNDSEELEKLRTLMATGYTQGKDSEIKRKILMLEDAIARNPVGDLIAAGLMPTIVEDIADDEDQYSYKSQAVRKVEEVTKRFNPQVVSAAKVIYMAHDTKMYQGLSRITQLSDFVARYTLYQHLTTGKTPIDAKEAVMRSSDAFVNYDIPMHRGLQWSDDMGITMFTKYFLGIQKELVRVAREHPARVLSAILLGQFMSLGPIVLDGSMWTKIGNNPLRNGAFMFLGSLSKLATVNGALSLIK